MHIRGATDGRKCERFRNENSGSESRNNIRSGIVKSLLRRLRLVFSKISLMKLQKSLPSSNSSPPPVHGSFRYCARKWVLITPLSCLTRKYDGCHVERLWVSWRAASILNELGAQVSIIIWRWRVTAKAAYLLVALIFLNEEAENIQEERKYSEQYRHNSRIPHNVYSILPVGPLAAGREYICHWRTFQRTAVKL